MSGTILAGVVGSLAAQGAAVAIGTNSSGRVKKGAWITAAGFPVIAGVGALLAKYSGAAKFSQALTYGAGATLITDLTVGIGLYGLADWFNRDLDLGL